MAENMTPEEEEALRRDVEAAFGHGEPQGPVPFTQNPYSKIKHVIGVVSGKGGVGKSLVSGIIATELARKGARVGILDADITGPSIPRMFGLAGTRMGGDATLGVMIPATTTGGIEVVSTNLLLEHESDPVLWRGPLLMGVLQQFFEDTAWGEIDCLVVDMPPGTGDVALTVFQQLPIEGIVVVSSPQDLVQMVVGKALSMARQMDIAVLGLVENMAYALCPDCGRRISLFGESKAAEVAAEAGVALLGELPIDPALAAACDTGKLEDELPEDLLPGVIDAIRATCPDIIAD